jgi:hypothetical protein
MLFKHTLIDFDFKENNKPFLDSIYSRLYRFLFYNTQSINRLFTFNSKNIILNK